MSSAVYDIIEMVAHRLPGKDNLYPAINTAIRLIATQLYIRRSDMIVSQLAVNFVPDASSATLPSDFWGLKEKPYQHGKFRPLEPLPDRETNLNESSAAIPEYYFVRNNTLYLTPPAAAAWSLTAEDISFDNASSEIRSAAAEFTVARLTEGIEITISDSVANDATVAVSSTTTTTGVITVDDSITDEAVGTEITLEAGAVIYGDYFIMPTKLTAPTDTIPFNEQFDHAISEAVIKIYTTGQVDAYIEHQVNRIVPYRDLKAPDKVKDVINWAGRY